ncbi:hypothetical protein HDU97_003928 [Phlyctochytrium planicorne]|nr:hypothetical protein HDU97_003928 [Phlyctochytrium planicorne]
MARGAIRGALELTARDGDAITSPEMVVNQDCAALHSMFPIVDALNCCGTKPRQGDGYYTIECSPDKTRIVKLELEWNPGEGSIEVCQLKICPFVSFDAFTTLTELVSAQLLIYARSFRTTFPKDLGNLKKLEYLNLVLDVTGPLPDSLNELVNLKTLSLSGLFNQFEEEEYNPISFPEEMGGLRSLQEMYVQIRSNFLENKIESIDNIRDLPNVTLLILGSNSIKHVPATLATLTNLQTLHLSYNNINTITGDFSGLVSLKKLFLGGNHLSSLRNFVSPPNLKEVDIGYNDFEAVPQVFANISSLESLDATRNFIKSLPDPHEIPQSLSKLQLSINCIFGPVNTTLLTIEGLDEKRPRQECDEHVLPVEPQPETSLSTSALPRTSSTTSLADTIADLLTTSVVGGSTLLPAFSITANGQKAGFLTTASQLESSKTLQDHQIASSTTADGSSEGGALPSVTPDTGSRRKNDVNDSRSGSPSGGLIAGVSVAGIVFALAVAVFAMWINRWRRREFKRRMLEPALVPLPSPPSDLEANQADPSAGDLAETGLPMQGDKSSGQGRLFNDELHEKRGGGLFDGVRGVDEEYEVKQREELQMIVDIAPVEQGTSTKQTPMKSVLNWSVEDVWAWVNSIGFREDVADTFRRHQIDGQKLLGLTDRILEYELGLTESRLRSSILTIRYKTFMEGRNLAEHFLPNRPDSSSHVSS